jgi:predicted transcriptional regulator
MGKYQVSVILQSPISSIMISNVRTCKPEDSIIEVTKLLVEEKFGAVPVVQDGNLVGIVSYVDLLNHFAMCSS